MQVRSMVVIAGVLLAGLAGAARAQSLVFRYVDPSTPGVGWAVRGAGDVDLDGVEDLAVAAYRHDCGFAGCGAGPSKLAVLSGATQAVLWSYTPPQLDGSGYALDVIGDLDGDGRPDLLVGAPGTGGILQQDGEAHVRSGADGSLLRTFLAPVPGANFGTSVAGVGDVDGDGVPDAAVATHAEVYVFSGANAQQLLLIPSLVPLPVTTCVARYGDFDGDGHADVLVGQVSGAFGFGGVVEVLSGATGNSLRAFASTAAESTFGWAVAATADFDGDTRPDVVVGTPQVDFGGGTSGPGLVELLGSGTGVALRSYVGLQAGGHLGVALAAGRDFDGDGVADLAAASSCDGSAPGCSRRAYVWSGSSGQLVLAEDAPQAGDFGLSLAFVGDLNGDGPSELAFGSACTEAYSNCGVVSVLTDPTPTQIVYCTAGTTSHGCVPQITASGLPRVGASSGYTLQVSELEGAQSALFFYGIGGRVALPWGGGSSFLCVKSPLERLGLQNSGGTALACDGALSVDWSAYVAAHPTALGAPFAAGDRVQAQAWFRDPPAPKTTNLSNALEFTLQP